MASAIHDPVISVKLALGEALTNLAAAGIKSTADITLSANWMAACSIDNEKLRLYQAVQSLSGWANECGLCIPVGKDSLSMQTTWNNQSNKYNVVSPVTAVITATAKTDNINQVLTPVLSNQPNTSIYFIDLAEYSSGLAGSCTEQVLQLLENKLPQICHADTLKNFISAIHSLIRKKLILAYHDRSDGGLITSCLEMAFAANCGMTIDINDKIHTLYNIHNHATLMKFLCNEGLGALIQIADANKDSAIKILQKYHLDSYFIKIAQPNDNDTLTISQQGTEIYKYKRNLLQQQWTNTSYHISSLRDNPKTASEEFNAILTPTNGLSCKITHNVVEQLKNINTSSATKSKDAPTVAILREQGTNGHYEMAGAFKAVGFKCLDITMTDLIKEPHIIHSCQGLAICGGFSYGDVLGAGLGWAQVIKHNPQINQELLKFWKNPQTFTLGVCNGCQVLSELRELIPGIKHFPAFRTNESQVFEARLSLVKINSSSSIFLKPLENCILPVVVSHKEGRVSELTQAEPNMQYVDHNHQVTMEYPHNPNGSISGACCFSSDDGRITIMMPHPERVFKTSQLSWHPSDWRQYSPWICCFQNLYHWAIANRNNAHDSTTTNEKALQTHEN